MFNVSALLLDDAFKLTTQLTNRAINEMLTFHRVDLMCGGIFSDRPSVVTSFLLILSVK